jgi:chemotaxis signal transduction protein
MRDPSGPPATHPPDIHTALQAAVQSLVATSAGPETMQQLLQLYEASLANPVPGRQHLVFSIAGITCAAPLAELLEVRLDFPALTPLPFSPPWLLGIFGVHNEPVGLVDLAAFMELECALPPRAAAARGEVAVLLARSEHGIVGLVVEQVGTIVWIGDEHRQAPPAPDLITERLARYVSACLVVPPDQQTPPLPTLLLLDLPQLLHDLLEPSSDGGSHA